MIKTHLNDSYNQHPHLFTDEFIEKLLARSLQYGTLQDTEWIINTFERMRTDTILYPHLRKSISNLGRQPAAKASYNFCFSHISKDFLSPESGSLLFLSVENNAPEVTRHILKEFSTTDISDSFNYTVKNNRINCLNALLENVVQHTLNPDTFEKTLEWLLGSKPSRGGTYYTIRDEISHEDKEILKTILQQPYLRALSQKLLLDKANRMINNIELNINTASYTRLRYCEESFIFVSHFLAPEEQKKVETYFDSCINRFLQIFNKKWPNQQDALVATVGNYISLGANVTKPNNEGKIPLQLFLSQPISKHMQQNGHYHFYIPQKPLDQMTKLLLSQNPQKQLSHTDPEGNTVLHAPSAALVMDLLIKNGADPDKQNNKGETPLLSFVKHNLDISEGEGFWPRDARDLFTRLFESFLNVSKPNTSSDRMNNLLASFKDPKLRLELEKTYKKWSTKNSLVLQKNMPVEIPIVEKNNPKRMEDVD